jgi:ribosome-binding protein aMBF1 (putative translation factor)
MTHETFQATEKARAELYYKLEGIEMDLKQALRETREEVGLSLKDVAKVIKKVFKPEEVKSLIKELK